MKLLQSKRMKLPTVYLISDREEIKDVPVGVPFIYGDPKLENHLVRVLEYETLYRQAVASGYPFDFVKILKDNGYKGIRDYHFSNPAYMEIKESDDLQDTWDLSGKHTISKDSSLFEKYVEDSTTYVDIQALKDLKVFPVWLDKIEDAIHTNIHNFAAYNPNMYNKKLDGMYGAVDLVSPNRNLIVIDISGSIPKAVSTTCLTLAKNLSETFYADLLITGSKSTLYTYEEIDTLDVTKLYDENGMDNDQAYFRKLVTESKRSYKTAIVFGDNHSPSMAWNNEYNTNTRRISRKDGQDFCEWDVEKLISFHTSSTDHIAGYADWFTPKTVEKVGDWVKYLKK